MRICGVKIAQLCVALAPLALYASQGWSGSQSRLDSRHVMRGRSCGWRWRRGDDDPMQRCDAAAAIEQQSIIPTPSTAYIHLIHLIHGLLQRLWRWRSTEKEEEVLQCIQQRRSLNRQASCAAPIIQATNYYAAFSPTRRWRHKCPPTTSTSSHRGGSGS